MSRKIRLSRFFQGQTLRDTRADQGLQTALLLLLLLSIYVGVSVTT